MDKDDQTLWARLTDRYRQVATNLYKPGQQEDEGYKVDNGKHWL